ncbi:MAG: hypothetical protein JXD18_10300 [Anaerolineae bacterium]|nr:hypothetical protein [Anaerolineae bacterium]
MIDQLTLGPSGERLALHDVIGGNLERLDDLVDVFVELFPQYAHTSERLRWKALRSAFADPHFINHQWLVEVDGRAAGLLSFKYAPQRGLGLTVYVGVRPAYRHLRVEGKRVSEWLIGCGLDQLQIDAQATGSELPVGLFLEVQYPRLVARYREFGFVELPVVYHEPHFRQARTQDNVAESLAQADFRRAYLGGFPIHPERFDPSDAVMLETVVRAFMLDHYHLPMDHWAVAQALRSIGSPMVP